MIPEKAKDIVTKIPVHFPASFDEIICGFLLKTPKSKARKNKIEVIKIIQTSIALHN